MDHPNIVKFYGYATISDEIVIVMSYINGSNLDTLLFGNEKTEVNFKYLQLTDYYLYFQFSESDTKFIAGEIVKGVKYMHHHDPVIIHKI